MIGIEYVAYARTGQLDRLPGCHNDMFVMRDLLTQKLGFDASQIYMLSDASSLYQTPTRANILAALATVVQKAKAGATRLVVYYSGHGTQVRDTNSDERDGKDECLVPCDFLSQGFLTDDTLNSSLLSLLPANVKCTLIADSCNSGTLYDLPYLYAADHTMKANPDKPAPCAASVITLSGCRDDQTSASAYNLERRKGWRGALTVSLEEAWNAFGYATTVEHVVESCRAFLKRNQYSQIPQLCSSRPIQPSTERFI